MLVKECDVATLDDTVSYLELHVCRQLIQLHRTINGVLQVAGTTVTDVNGGGIDDIPRLSEHFQEGINTAVAAIQVQVAATNRLNDARKAFDTAFKLLHSAVKLNDLMEIPRAN